MHFEWNEKTCAWMENASEYTGYNRLLSELLLKYIGEDETVCDMGCGLGLVDFELIRSVKSICCVDLSQWAVNYINARVKKEQLPIEAHCADGGKFMGRWDTVLALFHATPAMAALDYLPRANKRVILLTHDVPKTLKMNKFMIRKCSNVEDTCAWLDEHGVSYSLERLALDFGQPHRSFEEALDYTRTFSGKATDEELLAHTKDIVVETGREDYPLFTPKTRHFGMFVITP